MAVDHKLVYILITDDTYQISVFICVLFSSNETTAAFTSIALF